MKLRTLLGAFAAITAIASVAIVGVAWGAEGEILLLEGTFPASGTASSVGTTTFETTGSAVIVKCTSSEGTGTAESSVKGSFDALFLGCTAAGVKCTGLTDTVAGSILVKGTGELLAFKNGTTLDLATIATLEPVHFECLGILTEVKGSVIGLVTTPNGTVTTEVAATLVGSKGKQSITSVNGVEHKLLSETNGSSFVEASESGSGVATGKLVEVMY